MKLTDQRIQRLNTIENSAIKFIKTVRDAFDGDLYAGNSGGKDSAVLDYLLQKSGIDYISQYGNTTIDPPGTIKHIRDYYPHTEIVHPEESFYDLVERKGLPTRGQRFCCEILKEYISIGKNMFEGVRSSEGNNRKGRDYIQCDTRKSMKGCKHIYPIYDWTDKDVWDYIKWKGIVVAPCYGLGLHRLGCVGCCLVRKKGQRRKEFALYPRFYVAIRKAIGRGMAKNPQWKISVATDGDAELAMQWWLSSESIDKYFSDRYKFEKVNKVWLREDVPTVQLKINCK